MTTLSDQSRTKLNSMYEQDFHQWLMTTVQLLRDKSFEQIDLDNLIEELEAMGRSDRNILRSNLRLLLMHLLNYKYQPSLRSQTWESTLIEHRLRIIDVFADSPSLKQYVDEVFEQSYDYARKLASSKTKLPVETFPVVCPFTMEEIFDLNYLPK